MEVKFLCEDGQQLCSRRLLGSSDFFWDKAEIMVEFGNALEFDYTRYSWASVKLFLDCLHLIPAGPVDVATIIECIDFCQFEGKTTYDSFESNLVKGLMNLVMATTLPIGTELLISAYLSKVDNFDDRYQQKVAGKLTEEAVAMTIYRFDMNDVLNKRLIALCVKKGIFADESQNSVLITLMMYGKELQQFQAGNPEISSAAIESLDIDDDFIPDARSVRYKMLQT